jgi:hypothetical protein
MKTFRPFKRFTQMNFFTSILLKRLLAGLLTPANAKACLDIVFKVMGRIASRINNQVLLDALAQVQAGFDTDEVAKQVVGAISALLLPLVGASLVGASEHATVVPSEAIEAEANEKADVFASKVSAALSVGS